MKCVRDRQPLYPSTLLRQLVRHRGHRRVGTRDHHSVGAIDRCKIDAVGEQQRHFRFAGGYRHHDPARGQLRHQPAPPRDDPGGVRQATTRPPHRPRQSRPPNDPSPNRAHTPILQQPANATSTANNAGCANSVLSATRHRCPTSPGATAPAGVGPTPTPPHQTPAANTGNRRSSSRPIPNHCAP